MFKYPTGEAIHVGDIVDAGWGTEGVVELVIEPGSTESEAYACPQGGILIRELEGGGCYGRACEPIDRLKDNEDFKFLRRKESR